MIKLFRKIRQKVFTKNKLNSYLLYAFGEIILVVIGILIALQINTANQNRQRAKLETVLLEQVKSELLNIYGDVRMDAALLKIGNKSHDNINHYITQDAPYQDSLCFDFHWIKLDEYIYPVDAAYGKLKEEGLDIIKNDTIKFYLQSLYESNFPRMTKNNSFTPDISETLNDYYLEHFKPNNNLNLKYSAHVPGDTISSKIYSATDFTFPNTNSKGNQHTIGYIPLDFIALKKDSKYLMLLEQTRRFRIYKLGKYLQTKQAIIEVIKLIDRELE